MGGVEVEPIAPERRSFITINERKWELFSPGKFSWSESRDAKRVSNGMTILDIEEGIPKLDTDAWFAWIYVSVKREWPTVTVVELEAALGDTAWTAVVGTLELEAQEVADAVPLELGGDVNGMNDSADFGSPTPPVSTPETHGTPTS